MFKASSGDFQMQEIKVRPRQKKALSIARRIHGRLSACIDDELTGEEK
jgi:hypothetical protein